MNTVNILDVKIDDISLDEAVKLVTQWMYIPGKRYIVTPNPEFVVAAQKDKEFKDILNKADLAIPDGVGLRLSGKIKNRLTGIDLMEELIRLSWEKGFRIAFLGGKPGVAKRVADCLKDRYQNISVTFAEDGGQIGKDGEMEKDTKLNIPPSDILFVAFGHIKQEKWIASNMAKVPVKVFMAVGGAFDYLSQSVPRAPRWLQNMGLEWLFRLTIQPWRLKRQAALIKYLSLIIRG